MATLTKVAIFGGIASVAGSLFFANRIHENLQREEYHRKPVAMLRKYKPAVDMLGHPIRTGRMDLGDIENNRIDGLIAKLAIPVKGPKNNGTIYVWARRDKPGDSWEVKRLDLEVGGEQNRFTFHQTQDWTEFPSVKDMLHKFMAHYQPCQSIFFTTTSYSLLSDDHVELLYRKHQSLESKQIWTATGQGSPPTRLTFNNSAALLMQLIE